jgi:hypothetical protein
MFEWAKGNSFSPIITLYTNNITLNSHACMYFQQVRYCMIGINKEKRVIAIKPIPMETIDNSQISFTHLHRVSLGRGYARISNKAVLSEIAELLGRTLEGIKCNAIFDTKEEMLIADLNDVT